VGFYDHCGENKFVGDVEQPPATAETSPGRVSSESGRSTTRCSVASLSARCIPLALALDLYAQECASCLCVPHTRPVSGATCWHIREVVLASIHCSDPTLRRPKDITDGRKLYATKAGGIRSKYTWQSSWAVSQPVRKFRASYESVVLQGNVTGPFPEPD
jgi:hypothetical protein